MTETAIEQDTANEKTSSKAPCLSWSKYSEGKLTTIEEKILQYCRTSYRGWFVDVGPVVGASDRIWTISMNTDSTRTPLVLLHGLGAGVAHWCMNLDDLADQRPVYAMDVLGFGRSSRPTFSKKSDKAERQLVASIEQWRREMNLERFVLLGHSLGGFLAASYAISHPHRVKHLILADPWGFSEQQDQKQDIPLWAKGLVFAMQPLNPLWAVRAVGPFGQRLIHKVRSDLSKKYSGFIEDEHLITQYIYQCNAQTPSGESAFHAMMSDFGWAKNPMVRRIHELHKDVPITLLYGTRSWIDNSIGEIVKEKRVQSEVNLKAIVDAGHHVHADRPDVFNQYVNEACSKADAPPTEYRAIEQAATTDETPVVPPLPTDKTESDTESEKNQPTVS